MKKMAFSFLYMCVFIFLFLTFVNNSDARDVIDGVIAVVNDDVITLSEFEEKLPNQNANITPQQEKIILDQMIEQKLLEQQAEKLGIRVSESDVDNAIRSVTGKFNLTDDQMREVLAKENLTLEQFREQWRLQILSQKVIASKLQGKLAVTEDEIEEYYRTNYGSGEKIDEVKISHILISPDAAGGEDQAKQRADEIAERAKSGEDFEKLAREYSDDTISAVKGGELGYFKRGDLVESLESAAYSTPAGQVGGPVRSPAGYHIVKVLDKKTGEGDLDSYREEIKEKLYREKAQEELSEWINEIKRSAYIDLRI
ncbi:MAG: peptidylprolyl isomerase [Deltaproteobacteria bacterium]|nr:peptidylprolyl isomerase [Deltaproteobacteria bacterium]